MESLGAKLKNLREEKGYTLEHVARDTHIAKRYIVAIEEERFDEFPAEPYLLGFLRSYCEFLEIDPEEVVQLYRNMKLQEQPPPIDQLVAPKRGPSKGLVFGAIAGIALLVGIAFLVFQLFFAANAESADEPPAASTAENEFQFSDEFLEQRFRVGDTVVVPLNGEEFPIRIAAINDEVTLDTAGSRQVLGADAERNLDISNDGEPDIAVLLRSVDRAGEAAEAVLRFDRLVASPAALSEPSAERAEGSELGDAIGSTTVAARERAVAEIATRPSREAIDLSVEFNAPTLFRYRAGDQGDGIDQGDETFFTVGQSWGERLDTPVRVWSSNAGATLLRVDGAEVDLGDPGEPVSGALRYAETDDGRYRLELIPAY